MCHSLIASFNRGHVRISLQVLEIQKLTFPSPSSFFKESVVQLAYCLRLKAYGHLFICTCFETVTIELYIFNLFFSISIKVVFS